MQSFQLWRSWSNHGQRVIILLAVLLLIASAAYPPVKASRGGREQLVDERQFLLAMPNARTPDFNKLSLEVGVVIALAIAALLTNHLFSSRAPSAKRRAHQDPPSCNLVAEEVRSATSATTSENDLTAQARAILRSLPACVTSPSRTIVAPSRTLSQTESFIAGSVIMGVTLIVLYPAMQAQSVVGWRAYAETLAETLPAAAILASPFWLYQLFQRRRGHRIHPMLTLIVAWAIAMVAAAVSAR